MAHAGSWFGLPDFGVTEKIGSWLGTPTTQQGGSNLSALFSPQAQTSSTPSYAGTQSYPMSSTGGSVLGASTAGGGTPTYQQQPQQQQQQPQGDGGGGDPYAGLKGDISGGWDQYISSLDQQLGSIGTQKGALTGNVEAQKASSLADLDLSRTQGVQELEGQRTETTQNQARTLKDLAGNITNAMRAGQIYLGAQGAGDSSAANMYSYALTKLGTKERSNVMQNTAQILNEIGGRETNLSNIYTTEKTKLDKWADTEKNSIAVWYEQAVQQIQQAKSQGQLNKSQDLANLSKDILNQGLTKLNEIQQYQMSKQQALDQWAINNADSLAQAKSNLQQVANFNPTLPQAGKIAGTPQMSGGNMFTPTYGGGYSEEEKGLFG